MTLLSLITQKRDYDYPEISIDFGLFKAKV